MDSRRSVGGNPTWVSGFGHASCIVGIRRIEDLVPSKKLQRRMNGVSCNPLPSVPILRQEWQHARGPRSQGPRSQVLQLQNSRLSVNWDRIIRDDPTPQKGSAYCGRWNVREDRILLNPSYCIGLVQPTLRPARLQLDCSENVDEEEVEQCINEDSTLECCEVLSDDDVVSRVTCGSEETKIDCLFDCFVAQEPLVWLCCAKRM
ncbi:hypothetical protein AVEN_178969-1 [Araneus ventricosus]|uniref:Uncharacterized protein n=1 Tax=Araneus ventricosus TaxID=182803 RepID=A0A4Y2T7E7_ARAVE|nr:hypothetical protein AVEN_178969-1 [Araneus ventricosus]